MRLWKWWWALGVLLAGTAQAQPQSAAAVVPTCTVAQLAAGTCAPAREGVRVHITNGDAAVDTDCATTTGAEDIICEYNGSAWVTAPVLQTGSVTAAIIADSNVGAADIANNVCTTFKSQSINPTEASATDDFVNLIDNTIGTTDGAEDDFIVPVAMTAGSLKVDVDVAPGAGNDPWAITLVEAGSATTVTCTIDEAATTCDSAALTDAIAAGADMTVQVSSAGADADPTAAAQMRISFCFAP